MGWMAPQKGTKRTHGSRQRIGTGMRAGAQHGGTGHESVRYGTVTGGSKKRTGTGGRGRPSLPSSSPGREKNATGRGGRWRVQRGPCLFGGRVVRWRCSDVTQLGRVGGQCSRPHSLVCGAEGGLGTCIVPQGRYRGGGGDGVGPGEAARVRAGQGAQAGGRGEAAGAAPRTSKLRLWRTPCRPACRRPRHRTGPSPRGAHKLRQWLGGVGGDSTSGRGQLPRGGGRGWAARLGSEAAPGTACSRGAAEAQPGHWWPKAGQLCPWLSSCPGRLPAPQLSEPEALLRASLEPLPQMACRAGRAARGGWRKVG